MANIFIRSNSIIGLNNKIVGINEEPKEPYYDVYITIWELTATNYDIDFVLRSNSSFVVEAYTYDPTQISQVGELIGTLHGYAGLFSNIWSNQIDINDGIVTSPILEYFIGTNYTHLQYAPKDSSYSVPFIIRLRVYEGD